MSFRKSYITKPIFKWAKGVMPSISKTEQEAIGAGPGWWDGQLFSGNPDWDELIKTPPARLSPEEQAFMDGPVNELCGMRSHSKLR